MKGTNNACCSINPVHAMIKYDKYTSVMIKSDLNIWSTLEYLLQTVLINAAFQQTIKSSPIY